MAATSAYVNEFVVQKRAISGRKTDASARGRMSECNRQEMHGRLASLYRRHWKRLEKALSRVPEPTRNTLSAPFLLDVPLDYALADKKLMVFGKQANNWENKFREEAARQGKDATTFLMNVYRDFDVGKFYQPASFWACVHQLFRILNSACVTERRGESWGVLWNNVIKIDSNGGEPPPDVVELIAEAFPVIGQEIEITKPDAVLFLSGHAYDHHLGRALAGLRPELVGEFPKKQLARIAGGGLPRPSFRTYHPGFFAWPTQRNLYEEVLGAISDELLRLAPDGATGGNEAN